MSEYRAPCSKCSCLYEFLNDVLFTLDLMGDAKAYANSMFTISTEPRVSVGWVWKDSLEDLERQNRTQPESRILVLHPSLYMALTPLDLFLQVHCFGHQE